MPASSAFCRAAGVWPEPQGTLQIHHRRSDRTGWRTIAFSNPRLSCQNGCKHVRQHEFHHQQVSRHSNQASPARRYNAASFRSLCTGRRHGKRYAQPRASLHALPWQREHCLPGPRRWLLQARNRQFNGWWPASACNHAGEAVRHRFHPRPFFGSSRSGRQHGLAAPRLRVPLQSFRRLPPGQPEFQFPVRRGQH